VLLYVTVVISNQLLTLSFACRMTSLLPSPTRPHGLLTLHKLSHPFTPHLQTSLTACSQEYSLHRPRPILHRLLGQVAMQVTAIPLAGAVTTGSLLLILATPPPRRGTQRRQASKCRRPHTARHSHPLNHSRLHRHSPLWHRPRLVRQASPISSSRLASSRASHPLLDLRLLSPSQPHQ
jgi:hypothetical protein